MTDLSKATTEPSDKRDTQEIELIPTFVVKHGQYEDGVWFDDYKDLLHFLGDEFDASVDVFTGFGAMPKGESVEDWRIEVYMKPKGYVQSLEPYDP